MTRAVDGEPTSTCAVTDQRPVAFFDLDGTLIRGDSFLPFVVRCAIRRGRVGSLLRLPVVLALYATRRIADFAAKERILRDICAGSTRQELDTLAAQFADRWVRGRLRPAVVARLEQHQRNGHRTVLLSASPDLYVTQIGCVLGFHDIVCTRVAFDGECCLGALEGPNCKGPAKLAAARRLLGRDRPPPGSWAYGDSASDLPLLRWVDHGIRIRRGRLVPVEPAFDRAG